MAAMKERCRRYAVAAFLSLALAGLAIPSIALAAGPSPPSADEFLGRPINISGINGALPNGTLPARFTPVPTPITLVHLVLNQTSLPGERYMSFGPSVFDISIDPVLLTLLVGGIVVAAGARYVFRRDRRDDRDEVP
ncbi:MAG TPA: hypothetical protein VLU98_01110 [Methanomicrobiales archaeon]|nr:hypothetical protein [Methanomicrobiales archaeon]